MTIVEEFLHLDPKEDGASTKERFHLDIYDELFENLSPRTKLLEIGIGKGGSLSMWSKYFPDGDIIGVDRIAACKQFERDNIKVYIGDQKDPLFLTNMAKNEKEFDVIIDDGGCHTADRMSAFSALFPYLKDDGFYIVENIETCYQLEFGSHLPTFMSFAKHLCDLTTKTQCADEALNNKIKSIRFVKNMIIIEKGFQESNRIQSMGFDDVPYPV